MRWNGAFWSRLMTVKTFWLQWVYCHFYWPRSKILRKKKIMEFLVLHGWLIDLLYNIPKIYIKFIQTNYRNFFIGYVITTIYETTGDHAKLLAH